jgi:hypothetical protein
MITLKIQVGRSFGEAQRLNAIRGGNLHRIFGAHYELAKHAAAELSVPGKRVRRQLVLALHIASSKNLTF